MFKCLVLNLCFSSGVKEQKFFFFFPLIFFLCFIFFLRVDLCPYLVNQVRREDWRTAGHEARDDIPHRVIAVIVELDTEHLHRGHGTDVALHEVLEEAGTPSANHDNALRVLGRMEVLVRGGHVPDNNTRRHQRHAPHVFTRALESLANHLDMGLPGVGLHYVAVAVARVVGLRMRATCLIPSHVRDDDEILGLLSRADTIGLDMAQNQVHGLLEVRAQTLADAAILELSHTVNHILRSIHLVEDGIAVEGEEGILELRARDL